MKNWTDIPEPSLNPPEPEIVGYCPVCGEEIYKGNKVRFDNGVKIHPECILSYITEEFSNDFMADIVGYTEGIA